MHATPRHAARRPSCGTARGARAATPGVGRARINVVAPFSLQGQFEQPYPASPGGQYDAPTHHLAWCCSNFVARERQEADHRAIKPSIWKCRPKGRGRLDMRRAVWSFSFIQILLLAAVPPAAAAATFTFTPIDVPFAGPPRHWSYRDQRQRANRGPV
jgi:hypothetical protein